MAISDLFSSSFLFSIAIIIILIGGIFAFVSYRMSEQDHKLSSMVGLVSVLAQDLQFVKSKVNILQNNNTEIGKNEISEINLDNQSKIIGGNLTSELISVSDDEIDDKDEYESDEENSDDGSEEDEEEEDDYEEDSDIDETEAKVSNPQDQIKLLNLTLVNEEVENDSPIEELQCEFEELVQNNSNNIIKTIHLENPIIFEETEITLENQDESKILNNDINFLKNVSINDLGEGDDTHTNKSDYKKMSINKLREVAVTKGVISDASKLKKQEILKLLGEE